MSDEPVCICDHGRENIPCPIHNKPENLRFLISDNDGPCDASP